ncbi:MAG: hypothetical protein QOD30_322 [Actinomycetota bacterium]|jgi:uncharacterized protein (TIGR03084 family)|nr:hypothetical protein [Actinomycetota bacterium]
MGAAYGERVETIVAALAAQQAELTSLLDGEAWARPSRCEGWSVADVVLHLAQTNEMAQSSLDGTFGRWAKGFPTDARDVDDGADRLVARERGVPVEELRRRWLEGAAKLCQSFRACEPSARVQWVAGTMAARTLATTRLAETWIHTNDIAPVAPTARLEHIARLAWRTIPHAFGREGLEPPGATAFRLAAPGGGRWTFEPDVDPVNVIEGDGVELCEVASRRVPVRDTSLRASGPDATRVLELVRTWA